MEPDFRFEFTFTSNLSPKPTKKTRFWLYGGILAQKWIFAILASTGEGGKNQKK